MSAVYAAYWIGAIAMFAWFVAGGQRRFDKVATRNGIRTGLAARLLVAAWGSLLWPAFLVIDVVLTIQKKDES